MKAPVLRPNAIPVYGFLSLIHARAPQGEPRRRRNILDCGAGGPVPPLALFCRHGFEAYGIDTSWEQLERAKAFSREHNVDLHLRQGDMRRIPFRHESFDYVYEQYSMCHLGRAGTAATIGEMHRVLRSGGLCLLGVMSADTWPKSLFGRERAPGEYWGEENGTLTRHSIFTDEEADLLVSGWEVVSKRKQIRYLQEAAEELSLEDWMALQGEAEKTVSSGAWREHYERRADVFQYAHLYFVLAKP